MGFRNPLQSLSASQITPGALGSGVTITADQITAGTITGSTLQTVPSGNGSYIAIGKQGLDVLGLHSQSVEYLSTGDPSEYYPGILRPGMQMGASAAPTDQPYVDLEPPQMSGSNPNGTDLQAYLTLTGASRDQNTPGQLDAHVGGPVNLFAGELMTLQGAAGLALKGSSPGSPVTVDFPAQLAGETWHTLTLSTSAPWAQYDASTPPMVAKDAAGRAQVRGLVKSGYFQTTILVLPAGYRPPVTMRFTVMVAIDGVEKTIRVDVYATGEVYCGAGTGTAISYLSLDQLAFPTF